MSDKTKEILKNAGLIAALPLQEGAALAHDIRHVKDSQGVRKLRKQASENSEALTKELLSGKAPWPPRASRCKKSVRRRADLVKVIQGPSIQPEHLLRLPCCRYGLLVNSNSAGPHKALRSRVT